MDLRIKFTYPASYVPYRCTNGRTAHFRGETSVTIREVAPADAVPAFLVSDPGLPRFAPIDGRPRLMVAHDGLLWLEAMDAGRLAARYEREDYPLDTPFDACRHLHYEYRAAGRRQVAFDEPADIRRRNPGAMREWHDDGGEGVANRLALRARDMIVVGETLFVRDYEPCWENRRGRLSVATALADPGDPFRDEYRDPLRSAGERWRADRRPEALAAPDDGGVARIEVLDPRFLRYADDAEALLEAVGRAARALSSCLPALPVEAAECFYDVRDALAVAMGRLGPSLVDATVRVASLDPGAVPEARDGAEDVRKALGAAVDACAAAVARWERRPDDGREWHHLGLPVTATRQGRFAVREILDLDAAGRLARGLRTDLSAMEAAAASGAGRLLAVEPAGQPYDGAPPEAAILASEQPEAPGIAAAIGPDGGAASEDCAAAALGHLFRAAPVARSAIPSHASGAPPCF